MTGFASDIRPLFRDKDIDEMAFAFDLADYEAVKEHADTIYERLADGSMPCDDAWPPERIALFRSWIDGGHRP
jgi:hypothetical protein